MWSFYSTLEGAMELKFVPFGSTLLHTSHYCENFHFPAEKHGLVHSFIQTSFHTRNSSMEDATKLKYVHALPLASFLAEIRFWPDYT